METAIDGQVDDVLAVPAFLPKSSLVEVGVGINGSAATPQALSGVMRLALLILRVAQEFA